MAYWTSTAAEDLVYASEGMDFAPTVRVSFWIVLSYRSETL